MNPEEKSIQAPLIKPYELASELFEIGVNFTALGNPVHNIFHINRIIDYLKLIAFPTNIHLMPRRMTVFSLFFLTKGKSIRTKGLDKFSFGENTLFITPAYQIFTHEYISPDAEGFYCHFSLDLLTSDYRLKDLLNDFPFLNFNAYPLINIDTFAKESILPLLERLEKEYKTGANCRHDILRVYLIALFTELKQFEPPPQYSSTSNAALHLTEQFKNALSKHIYQKQKVTDYADMLNVTPNHLNKCVKNTLGKSAHDLLSDMLLLEAKVLLKQTNLTISEIAFKIGRNETSDFARFFKAQTGMKPSEYRNLR